MIPCVYLVYLYIKKTLIKYATEQLLRELQLKFLNLYVSIYALIPEFLMPEAELPQSFAVASQPSGTHQNSEPRRARA